MFDQVSKKAVSKLANQSVWKQALTRMRPTALNALEEAGQEGFHLHLVYMRTLITLINTMTVGMEIWPSHYLKHSPEHLVHKKV